MKWCQAIAWILVLAVVCESAEPARQFTVDEVIVQAEQMKGLRAACGPMSLARCTHLLEKPQPYADLLARFPSKTSRGVQLSELATVANDVTGVAQGVQIPGKRLSSLPVPSILIVGNGHHCVVFEGLADKSDAVLIWDPNRLDQQSIATTEFSKAWTGDAIIFGPLTPPTWTTVLLIGLTVLNLIAGGSVLLRSRVRSEKTFVTEAVI